MRQNHKAGEKLFVDYCGPTMKKTKGVKKTKEKGSSCLLHNTLDQFFE